MKLPYTPEKLEGTCRTGTLVKGTELPTSLAGLTFYKHPLLPCKHPLVHMRNRFRNQGLCGKREDTNYPKPVKC